MLNYNLMKIYNRFDRIVVSATKMVQIEKLEYEDFNAMCLQEMSIRSNSVTTVFSIYDKNDCHHVHYSILKQWQSIRMVKEL